MAPLGEISAKTGRLTRLLAEQGLDGVLLGTLPSFAWITAGRCNGVDLSREVGVATVLIARDGRRFLLTSTIEMARFLHEELAGQDWTPVELPWTEAGPEDLAAAARALAGPTIAADWPVDGLPWLEPAVARERRRLTPPEIERFRALGRDAGEALGEVCRRLEPGLTEIEIARRTAAALAERGLETPVLLVGADERLERYRHPLPTGHRWRDTVMVVVCARRAGLVAALTRIVRFGPVPDEIRRRTRAAAEVAARLLAATRPGASGSELFGVAARAYADLGFPGEEKLHHQGGPCGYLSRDWIASPRSEEQVEPPQAFAWNPSITGTKVEDTWLVPGGSGAGGAELLTPTPGWPRLEIEAGGTLWRLPDVASLGNF
jgi:antitoxin VapB